MWAAANQLLKGLKNLKHHQGVFDNLPSDVRTILKTPTGVENTEIGGGTYYHFGLAKGLQRRLALKPRVNCNVVIVNFDGLPLFNGSRGSVLAHLGAIERRSNPIPYRGVVWDRKA